MSLGHVLQEIFSFNISDLPMRQGEGNIGVSTERENEDTHGKSSSKARKALATGDHDSDGRSIRNQSPRGQNAGTRRISEIIWVIMHGSKQKLFATGKIVAVTVCAVTRMPSEWGIWSRTWASSRLI